MAIPFRTPVNQLSFSSLIDEAILATGKPGSLTAAVQFANLVVRECQTLGLFAQDLIEEAFVVPSGQTTVYTWERPANFRSLRSVKYGTCGVYPELALPGRKQRGKTQYFYAADNYFVFSGALPGETIGAATYYWRPRLGYFNQFGVNSAIFPGGPYPDRPAYYDEDLGIWQYLALDNSGYVDTIGNPTEEELRRRNATNWLVTDWRDLILSGTKTKIWTSAGDARGATEYSVYKQLQKSLQNTAAYEGEGF